MIQILRHCFDLPGKRCPVLLFFLLPLLLPSCASSRGDLFTTTLQASTGTPPSQTEPASPEQPGDESGESDTEEEEMTASEPALIIDSSPDNADLYFDGIYVGETPQTLYPDGGSHRLRLEKAGYYPYTAWVEYDVETRTVIQPVLERITGFINVEVPFQDARIFLGTEQIDQGITELPVGYYRLLISTFGYLDWESEVVIQEKRMSTVKPQLTPAPFELKRYHLDRKILNPDNPGALGTVKGFFLVTSWGDAEVAVLDRNGQQLHSFALDAFTREEQDFSWDGRNAAGTPFPDGVYTVELRARPRTSGSQNSAPPPLRLSTTIEIDHSAVTHYRAAWSDSAGLVYTPGAEVLPPGGFQTGSLLMAHSETSGFSAPIALNVRYAPAENIESWLTGGIIPGSYPNLPGIISGGLKYRLLRNNYVQSAIQLKATWLSGSSADTFANFTGISAATPLELHISDWCLILNPELQVSDTPVEYGSETTDAPALILRGYLKGGILYQRGGFSTGISAALRSGDLLQSFDWQPPLALGLEVNWLIPETRMGLSFLVGGEWSAFNNYYLSSGGGVHLIY